MALRKYRLLLVCSHPVQYMSPVLRVMAQCPRLEIQVAFCSLQGAESAVDPDFGRAVQWDVPLLDGFPWVQLKNRSPKPRLGPSFWGLVNPGIWRMVRKGGYDAVVFYTGYRYATFWIGLAAAKLTGAAALFGTDASSISIRDGWKGKLWFKPFILSRIYRRADAVWAASAAGKQYLMSLGLPEARIGIVPLVVDNDWWMTRASEVDRAAVRAAWGISPAAPVVLFCAKLQPWKRPQDLLEAFARAAVPGSHLVFAGDGALAQPLAARAAALGIQDRVHFLGFQNQSQLPAVYGAADFFVLPSEYDPCPAVVCEAMLCGLPAAISDEIRGRFELIDQGQTGYKFPCGDVDALAAVIRSALADPERLAQMGHAARQKMHGCSPRTNVEAFLRLLETNVAPRQP